MIYFLVPFLAFLALAAFGWVSMLIDVPAHLARKGLEAKWARQRREANEWRGDYD